MTVLTEVLEERERQIFKYGDPDLSVVEFISLITEELGEAATAANDYHHQLPYEMDGETFEYDRNPMIQQSRIRKYRQELVQVAAMAVQAVETLDKQKLIDQQ